MSVIDVYKRQAQDFMKVGDEVEAVILTLDRDERKMSLGIKQLKHCLLYTSYLPPSMLQFVSKE